jgi:hypothetical protein
MAETASLVQPSVAAPEFCVRLTTVTGKAVKTHMHSRSVVREYPFAELDRRVIAKKIGRTCNLIRYVDVTRATTQSHV